MAALTFQFSADVSQVVAGINDFVAKGVTGVNSLAQKITTTFDGAAAKARAGGEHAGTGFVQGVTEKLGPLKEKIAETFKGAGGILGGGAMLGGIAGMGVLFEKTLEKGKEEVQLNMDRKLAYQQAGLGGEELNRELKRSAEFANELSQRWAIDDDTIQKLAKSAATLGGATGKSNDEMVKMSLAAEKATGGVVSAEGAIRLFAKGAADPENAAALDRLKGKFPDLYAAMKGGKDPAEKMQLALKALGPTFGAMAEQANGPLGAMKRFEIAMDNVMKTVGAAIIIAIGPLMQVMGAIAGVVQDYVLPAFTFLSDKLGAVGPVIAGVVGAIGLLVAALTAYNAISGMSIIATVASSAAKAVHTIVSIATTVATWAQAAATWALAAAMTVLTSPITLIVVGIGLLIAGLIYAYRHSETFRNILSTIWTVIKALVLAVWEIIKGYFEMYAWVLKVTGVLGFLTRAFEVVKSVVGAVAGFFSDLFSSEKQAPEGAEAHTESLKGEGEQAALTGEQIKTLAEKNMKAADEYATEVEAKALRAGKTMKEAERAALNSKIESWKNILATVKNNGEEDYALEVRLAKAIEELHKPQKGAEGAEGVEREKALRELRDFLKLKNETQKGALEKQIAESDKQYEDERKKINEAYMKRLRDSEAYKKADEAEKLAMERSEQAKLLAQNAEYAAAQADLDTASAAAREKVVRDFWEKVNDEVTAAHEKLREEERKYNEEEDKASLDAHKKHAAAEIALIVDEEERRTAEENERAGEERVADDEAMEKRRQAAQKNLGDGVITWQQYRDKLSALKREARTEEEDREARHARALTDIENNAGTLRNNLRKNLAEQGLQVQTQFFSWLDERTGVSGQNQKTLLFGVQSSIYTSLKESLAKQLASWGTFFATKLGLMSVDVAATETAEGAKKQSFLTTAAAAVWSAMETIGAWVAAAAASVASAAVFIASNLAVAASYVAAAAAAAFEWLVATLGPFGLAAAVGVVAGLIGFWSSIKQGLGFERGGIGMIGEKGPEVIAPVQDFSDLMSGLISATVAAIAQPRHGGQSLSGAELIARMDGIVAAVEKIHSNITTRTTVEGTMKADGGELYSAIAHSTLTSQVTRAS